MLDAFYTEMGNWIVLFFTIQWKNPLLFNKKGLEKYLKSGFITRLNREKKWIKHCNLTFSISFFLVNEIVNYLSQPLGFFYCTSQASLSFCLFPSTFFLHVKIVFRHVCFMYFFGPHSQLEQKQVTPPYRPRLESDRDLANFPPEFTDEPVQLTPDDA